MSVADQLARLPVGTSQVLYRGRRWSVTRTVQQDGRVEKLWAEELGGRAFVSANLYLTSDGGRFRPCEMPASVVLDFLGSWTPLPDVSGTPGPATAAATGSSGRPGSAG